MVLTKEEYVTRIKSRLGDELSDEDITLLEDMSDTYDELDKNSRDNIDWKQKYDDLDKDWRKRYTDRFNDPVTNEPETYEDVNDNGYQAPRTFAELFATKEN